MKPIENKEIAVEFDGKKCIHARRCVLGLPDVFQPGAKGGWIFPDNAAVEDIVRIIDTCPSGALVYRHKGADTEEATPKVNTARLWENGPIEFRGELVVSGTDNAKRRVLCRCGQSSNKPYCDNSHIKAKFDAPAHANSVESDIPQARDGKLDIKPIKDGPLSVAGCLEIIAGSGSRIAVGEKQFLCRCGASKNKPFCDGSHKGIGFKAD